MWQYASVDSVIPIVLSTLAGAVATYLYSLLCYAFTQPENYNLLHRMVYLLYWVLLTVLIGGSRFAYRIIVTHGMPWAIWKRSSPFRLRRF